MMNSSKEQSGPTVDRSLVRAEYITATSSYFRRLAFIRPLEAAFESRVGPSRSRRLYLEGLCLIGISCLVAFADLHSLGTRSHLAWLMRFLFTFPLLYIGNDVLRHNPTKRIREGSVGFVAAVMAGTNTYFCANISTVNSVIAQAGLIISLIVTGVVMRLRLAYAAISAAVTLLIGIVFLSQDHFLSPAEKVSVFVPVCIAALFTLVGSYSLEREERLSFLLQLGNELQQEEMQSLNVELERLSSQDGLTGLANRAAFDRHFQTCWEEAGTERTPFSLILIDIDHFKRVNDTHGHQYGDEVLKRVAVLTRESLRGTGEFAARYGGEEFVILLPNTLPEAARMVAERIRSLVELAGSPSGSHEACAMWTTVSCGVAGVELTVDRARRDLLRDADEALYRAKAAGRNRVSVARKEVASFGSALLYQPA